MKPRIIVRHPSPGITYVRIPYTNTYGDECYTHGVGWCFKDAADFAWRHFPNYLKP